MSADQSISQTIAKIRQQSESIRRKELQRALQRLNEEGELTDEQEAAVEALTERLVDQLLAVPRQRLNAVADEEEAETVIELFA